MCNIFVLILYINNKQSVPLICAFFFFFSCCVIIYLFLFLTPVKVFLSKLMCGCPRGLMRGTDLEFSGMSSKWFLACNVINVRLSSAHCITNQCYHSKFKCNHVQKNADLYYEWKSVILLSRTRFRWKKNILFHLRIYKYLLTQFTVERGMCVYILIKGKCFSLGWTKIFCWISTYERALSLFSGIAVIIYKMQTEQRNWVYM